MSQPESPAPAGPARSYLGVRPDPAVLASWASFEGLPDLPEPAPPPPADDAAAAGRSWLARRGNRGLAWLGTALPGVGLAGLLAWLGVLLSGWVAVHVLRVEGKSPLSPILFAVVLGLLLRNTLDLPATFGPGLRWCTKTLLRLGIVLLGLGLSLAAVAQLGLVGLPIIVGCIATALVAVTWINRALDLPRRLGTLIAVGTSICGVSAIVATAPAIDAEEDETSYAVACITIFGLVALFTYPFLAHWLFDADAQRAGLFLGTAIHDTAQVAGAGAMYRDQYASEEAMNAAVTVKLVRNLSMSVLIPLLAVMYHRSAARAGSGEASAAGTVAARPKWHQAVPLFVVGFVLLALVRTIGDRAADRLDAVDAWQQWIAAAGTLSAWCLAVAMAGVGLGTDLAKLRGLGWKPFTVGLAAALLVGVASFVLIVLLT